MGTLLVPTWGFLRQLPDVGLVEQERYDLPAALEWLRTRTPATSFFDNPHQMPEYGVLSEWGLGAYVDYSAQRPTVATNFGWETSGLFESVTFLTGSDPAAALAILHRCRVRYLLMNDVTGKLPDFREMAEYGSRTGRFSGGELQPFKALTSLYYRLYIQDGSAYQVGTEAASALGTYRLVYESPNGTIDPMVGTLSHYKVFEVVSGAKITADGPPGALVELHLPLRTQTGRTMQYRDTTTVDGHGSFTFRVPYATEQHPGAVVVPQGPYRVALAGKVLRAKVSEQDVQTGRTVQVH